MNPRRLNLLVDVLREELRQDSDGEMSSQGWKTKYAKIPAKREDVQGGETLRGLKVEATVGAVFTLRWMPDVLVTDRVSCDGQLYEVKAALNIDGRREWLTVAATSVPRS